MRDKLLWIRRQLCVLKKKLFVFRNLDFTLRKRAETNFCFWKICKKFYVFARGCDVITACLKCLRDLCRVPMRALDTKDIHTSVDHPLIAVVVVRLFVNRRDDLCHKKEKEA